MNRSSACKAGLILTPGQAIGYLVYENGPGPIWITLEKRMRVEVGLEKGKKQLSVKYKIYDLMQDRVTVLGEWFKQSFCVINQSCIWLTT